MRLHKLWIVLLSLEYGINAQDVDNQPTNDGLLDSAELPNLFTDMEFEQAPYIVYPDGMAHKETSMPESSLAPKSSSYPDESDPESEHELGELEMDFTTVSTLYISTVPVTVHLPMETDMELATELSTEVIFEYYTVFSDLSIEPLTVTVTVSSDMDITQSGSMISSTPNPTTLQQSTYTIATTEYITSSITEQGQVNTDVNVQTVTTTLPATITPSASTTTMLVTATNTMEVTATQSTQGELITITETEDVTVTETETATISTTEVIPSTITATEDVVTVNEQTTITMSHTSVVYQQQQQPQQPQQPEQPQPEQPQPEQPQPEQPEPEQPAPSPTPKETGRKCTDPRQFNLGYDCVLR